jgi:hypothetical protein
VAGDLNKRWVPFKSQQHIRLNLFITVSSGMLGALLMCRRKPHAAPPPDWSSSREEPSALRSLADFTDSMGSAMAALGLFAQVGEAGGVRAVLYGALNSTSPQACPINKSATSCNYVQRAYLCKEHAAAIGLAGCGQGPGNPCRGAATVWMCRQNRPCLRAQAEQP